jgi:hypothetical protein
MLYPQLLRDDFGTLPGALRRFHSAPTARATGTVSVRHSNRWLARLIGFPKAGEWVNVELHVIAQPDSEWWIRQFDGAEHRSLQRLHQNLLLETAGPIRVLFRVAADSSGMTLRSHRAWLWILPLPLRIQAKAWGDDESWSFEVNIAGIGSYRGKMVPAV